MIKWAASVYFRKPVLKLLLFNWGKLFSESCFFAFRVEHVHLDSPLFCLETGDALAWGRIKKGGSNIFSY